MDVCTAAKKKKKKERKKKQMMKLEIPRVFSNQWFSRLLVFRIREAMLSNLSFGWETKRKRKPSPFSLFFSLSFLSLSREKLAHDAKFRDFIDRKVSPVFRPFFVEFSKKIALPVKPHGHGLCRREIRSIHLVRELPAKEGCKTSKIYF